MKKISLSLLIAVFFFSSVHALGEYNGEWHRVDSSLDKCDFIGDAILNVNFKTLKIKVKKWRWRDSNPFKEKMRTRGWGGVG